MKTEVRISSYVNISNLYLPIYSLYINSFLILSLLLNCNRSRYPILFLTFDCLEWCLQLVFNNSKQVFSHSRGFFDLYFTWSFIKNGQWILPNVFLEPIDITHHFFSLHSLLAWMMLMDLLVQKLVHWQYSFHLLLHLLANILFRIFANIYRWNCSVVFFYCTTWSLLVLRLNQFYKMDLGTSCFCSHEKFK